MRALYLRIYLTVVAALALFALVSGWLLQQQLDEQRLRAEAGARERLAAWSELLQASLPPADAPRGEQAAALRDWAKRLRVPMALDDANGQRIGATESFLRREAERPGGAPRLRSMTLDDGRVLWVARPLALRGRPGGGPPDIDTPRLLPPGWPDGLGLVLLLVVLFMAVAAGASPWCAA